MQCASGLLTRGPLFTLRNVESKVPTAPWGQGFPRTGQPRVLLTAWEIFSCPGDLLWTRWGVSREDHGCPRCEFLVTEASDHQCGPGPFPPLHRSWFSGVWGLFSRPSPPASAQWSYKSRDPFISSPATTLPAPLIVRQTRLWTQSKLSVSSGFHVSSTEISLQVWRVISMEEGALYPAIRAAVTVI